MSDQTPAPDGYLRAVDDDSDQTPLRHPKPYPTPADFAKIAESFRAAAAYTRPAPADDVRIGDQPVDVPTDEKGHALCSVTVEFDGCRVRVIHDVQRWIFGERGELNIYGGVVGGRIAKVATFAPNTVTSVQRNDRETAR